MSMLLLEYGVPVRNNSTQPDIVLDTRPCVKICRITISHIKRETKLIPTKYIALFALKRMPSWGYP